MTGLRFLARLRLLPVLSMVALSALWGPSRAELTSQRPAPLAPDARNGRVIVKFKAEATLAQARILSAAGSSPSAEQVAQRLQARATGLGHRHGLALRSGRAIDGRTQVMMADGVASTALAARLSQDPEVEYAVVDARHRRLRIPNDPLYVPTPVPTQGPAVGQWYLKPPQAGTLTTGNEVVASIDAQGAWDITTGHSSTIVAVLDTGVRRDHPDLAGKLLPGFDMISDPVLANDGDGRDADPSDPGDWINAGDVATPDFEDCEIADSSWHGTQTAGLIAAATNNATGMAGAGWRVRVLPMRVLGKCFGYESDITAAMRWAAGLDVPGTPVNPHPAKVINLSLGRPGACDGTYPDAIAAVRSQGVVVVASAGNSTGHAVNVPANCSGVIGVAAVRHIGTKVGFSDVGPQLTIAAPGGNCVNIGAGQPCLFPILTSGDSGTTVPGSAIFTDSFNISVGTSFSAPLVSATVALMMTANRSLTPDQVKAALQGTARPFPSSGAPADPDLGAIQQCHAPNGTDQLQCYCTTTTCGAGLLDARAAVAQVARLEAYIEPSAETVAPSQAVTFSSDSTVLPAGRTIASYQWTLESGGSIVSLPAATDTATLTVTPSAAGSFGVRLTVVDSTGATSTTTSTVTVSPLTPPPSTDGGGGGGGALNPAWLLALCAAVLALRRAR
jgi:serine protease